MDIYERNMHVDSRRKGPVMLQSFPYHDVDWHLIRIAYKIVQGGLTT